MRERTDTASGRQSRRMSLIEAIANVGVGYAVAVLTQILVFPLFGLRASLSENLALGGIFTIASIARSYTLRRVFEAIRVREIRTRTAGHEGPAALGVRSANQVGSITL